MTPKAYSELRQDRFEKILAQRQKDINDCINIIHRNNANMKSKR
jgi:hypothetical protein